MKPLIASEIYALSQGHECKGTDRCHWCSAPCDHSYTHDDIPRMIGCKTSSFARCPGNHWICKGCWLWRRPRITVNFMGGVWTDGKTPKNFSWWITDTKATAVSETEYPKLWSLLLKPPRRFILALKGDSDNHIHRIPANDISTEITTSTILQYSVDNKPMWYTINELEQCVSLGAAGREPGAQYLFKLMGLDNAPSHLKKKPEVIVKTERNVGGRPTNVPEERRQRRTVLASGM